MKIKVMLIYLKFYINIFKPVLKFGIWLNLYKHDKYICFLSQLLKNNNPIDKTYGMLNMTRIPHL